MKRKRVLLTLFWLFLITGLDAQFWQPLEKGIPNTLGGARVVLGDTVWDRLLVGSPAKWIINGPDTLVVAGIAQWDGWQWDTLASRIQPTTESPQNFVSPVNDLWRFNGQLYAGGYFHFQTPDSLWNNYIGRWSEDDGKWEALECINPSPGMLTMLHVSPNDTMYFTGYRASICGYPESCVFKYDGNDFQPFAPFDSWPGYSGDYVGYVFWFQDQLYMTGLLHHSITNTTHGFLRYDGSSWEEVPGFETPAPIKDVLIYDDKLYVCGYFFTNTGAPGNMVTVFDGQQWSDMGGGLRYDLPNGTLGNAYDLHEWNGDIYVAGQFNYAGGVYAENVARWNGQQWCGMGGHYANQMPGGQAKSLTTWRDTLYMAGGFVTIDGDTLYNVAKWLGQVENCSPAVGVPEPPAVICLIPILLEGEGRWQLQLPYETSEIRFYGMQGQLLHQERVLADRSLIVDLAPYPPGIYLIECLTRNGLRSRAKLYRP